MAVTLIGGTGLFDKVGALFGTVVSIVAHLNQLDTDVDTDVQAVYTDDPDLASAVSSNLQTMKTIAGGNMSFVQTSAQKTLVEMVHDDNKLVAKTVNEAMKELIAQMDSSSDDVNAPTVGGNGDFAPAAGSTGNGRLILDVVDGKGKTKEYLVGENITALCTKDSQTSGTVGRETFSVKGEDAVASRFSDDWPDGSGRSKSVQVTDPSVDASGAVGRNRLTNSDFEDFTSDVPDNWQLDTGVGGTNCQATTTKHRGTNALEIIGDGTTNFELTQEFGLAAETSQKLFVQKRYCFGLWIKRDGTAAASGTLRMNIVGVSGQTDIDLTALTTTYVLYTYIFSSPLVLSAAAMEARLALTVLLTSPRSVFVDSAFVAEMIELYPGGPNFLIVPGSTEYILDDQYVQAVTNDQGGLFQKYFDQFYDMRALGLILPSDTGGTETISDTLVA